MRKSLLLLCLLLGAGAAPLPCLPARAQVQPQLAAPLRVAVLPFKNLSRQSDDEWLSEAFAESLSLSLLRVKDLQQVERARLQQVLQEHYFGQSVFADAQTAPRLGQLLGAEVLLLGAYQRVGDQLQVSVRLVNVQTGQVDTARFAQVEGAFEQLFGLQKQLARELLRSLALSPDAQALQALDQNLSATASTSAYRYYAEGMQQLRKGHAFAWQAALKAFGKALIEDPDYALALAGLAEAHAYIAQDLLLLKVQPPGQNAAEHVRLARSLAAQALSRQRELPQVHRALARLAQAEGQPEQALAAARQALSLNPYDLDSVNVYFDQRMTMGITSQQVLRRELQALGVSLETPHLRLRLLELAYDALILRREPDFSELAIELSALLPQLPDHYPVYLLQARLAQQQKQPAQGLQALAQVEPLVQELPEGLIEYAFLALELEQPDKALQAIQRAESLSPRYLGAQMALGHYYAATGQLEAALRTYRDIDARMPAHPLPSYLMGSYLFAAERYAEALPLLQQALQRWQQKPDFAYGPLANLLMSTQMLLGDYAAAAATARTLLSDHAFYGMAYTVLGLHHTLQQNHAEALKVYQALLQVHPESREDPELMLRYRRAYLNVLLEKEPDNSAALNDLGQIIMAQSLPLQDPEGREQGFQTADVLFERALELSPATAAIWYNRGLLYFYRQRHAEARRHFEQALQRQPDYLKAWVNLALSAEALADAALARSAWHNVLRLDPDHAEARQRLAASEK